MRALVPVALAGCTTVRKVFGAVVAGAVVCATACESGFFAPRAPTSGVARLALTATASAGGSAAAFDRTDAVRLRLTRGGRTALDTVLAFGPAGTETHVTVAVPLELAFDSARYELELRSAGSAVFVSSGTVLLQRGQTTTATVVLLPVAAALRLSAPTPAFSSIGDTAWAHAAVLFSTGDTLRTVRPAWTSLDPDIVGAGPDSLLVARAEGEARLQASAAGLVQSISVKVNAAVTSVAVTPRNPTMQLQDAPLAFSAVARDRRGNPLARSFTWSSSNASVAQVSATGVVAPVTTGTTFIIAAAGAIRDSSLLTVAAPPAPPVLSGGSVTLIQAVDPVCYHAGTGLTGSSHRISLDFSDVNGDVVLAVSAVGGSWVGYPSGNGGSLVPSSLRDPNLSGTGAAGQIQFTLCFIFRTDLYDDVTVTLTDAAGLTGASSPIRILKPSGGS